MAARKSKKRPAQARGKTNTASAKLRQLQQVNRKLRAQIRQLEVERDDYRQTVHAFLKKEFKEAAEKPFRVEDYHIPAEDVLAELDALSKPAATPARKSKFRAALQNVNRRFGPALRRLTD